MQYHAINAPEKEQHLAEKSFLLGNVESFIKNWCPLLNLYRVNPDTEEDIIIEIPLERYQKIIINISQGMSAFKYSLPGEISVYSLENERIQIGLYKKTLLDDSYLEFLRKLEERICLPNIISRQFPDYLS